MDKFNSNELFENFVDIKDLNVGDAKVYYTSDCEEQCKEALDEYLRESKYKPIKFI